MADEDEAAVLVLQRYGHHREIVLYPTSRIVRANCGHLAWLSPQGEGMFETAYTTCTDCHEESVLPDDAEQVAVPGAVEAWRELFGDKVADTIRQGLRENGVTEL